MWYVVTCNVRACIQVSFALNGKALGVAFDEIRVFEPQLAYFPAVSLSEGEAAYVNLGNTPLRFPLEGFRPMQAPPPVYRSLQCTWLLEKMSALCTV
jgi:Kip1 ubiquitination-promoting complex protein 1